MERNKRKPVEWERLEISSRKLEIPREHFMQEWTKKRTEMVKRLRRGGKNTHRRTMQKKGLNGPDNHDGVVTHP